MTPSRQACGDSERATERVIPAGAFPVGSSLTQAAFMMTTRRETVANQQADSCPE
jgi:hypothetical protein